MRTLDEGPKYYVASLTNLASKQLANYYNRVLAPFGITAHQAMALGVLWREESISLGVFAERAGIGKAAAVTMIKRLEVLGLVVRNSHPKDARLNSICLTDRARELSPEIFEKVRQLEDAVEKALGKERLQILLETLTLLSELSVDDF